MDKNIKNFRDHVKSLWVEYCLKFIDSLNPNPIDILNLIDDITLELADDDWVFESSVKIRDNNSYRVYNFIGWTRRTNTKKSTISLNGHDDSEFLRCIERDNYKLVYDIHIHPPGTNKHLSFLINGLNSIIKRLENEFSVNIIEVKIRPQGGREFTLSNLESASNNGSVRVTNVSIRMEIKQR